MKLKNIRYTGRFEDANCGLVHPFRDEFVYGCGKRASLEHFEYTLEDGKTRSTVALCPACAAKQMAHRRVRLVSVYGLYVGQTAYARARYDKDYGDGWRVTVNIAGQTTELWARTLTEAEADALVWYRYFTKGMD